MGELSGGMVGQAESLDRVLTQFLCVSSIRPDSQGLQLGCIEGAAYLPLTGLLAEEGTRFD